MKDIVETVITTKSGETTTIADGYLDVGILDTMKDLLVNLIGAVVFSAIGYISLRASGSSSRAGKVVESLMAKPNVRDE